MDGPSSAPHPEPPPAHGRARDRAGAAPRALADGDRARRGGRRRGRRRARGARSRKLLPAVGARGARGGRRPRRTGAASSTTTSRRPTTGSSCCRCSSSSRRQQQRIIYLRYFEDMTQAEIAKEMGVSQMQVSRLLARSLVDAGRGRARREGELAGASEIRRNQSTRGGVLADWHPPLVRLLPPGPEAETAPEILRFSTAPDSGRARTECASACSATIDLSGMGNEEIADVAAPLPGGRRGRGLRDVADGAPDCVPASAFACRHERRRSFDYNVDATTHRRSSTRRSSFLRGASWAGSTSDTGGTGVAPLEGQHDAAPAQFTYKVAGIVPLVTATARISRPSRSPVRSTSTPSRDRDRDVQHSDRGRLRQGNDDQPRRQLLHDRRRRSTSR